MWKFRPSAFIHGYYESVSTLLQMYQKDNERAAADGVEISPRSTLLRTCQWNVHFFSEFLTTTEGTHQDGTQLATLIVNTLKEVDADIIVLNEFGMSRGYEQEVGRDVAKTMLQAMGYSIYVADCYCPTAVATRLPVEHDTKFQLDIMRDAVGITVRLDKRYPSNDDGNDTTTNKNNAHVFSVYGTHLEDSDEGGGKYRLNEIKCLLETIGVTKNHVMIMGDFNQQRKQDYTHDEWQMIVENKARRQSPLNDGVAYLLQAFGYVCIYDTPTLPYNNINWNKRDPPPSTHWSGTIVDYTYYKDDILELTGVFVSPSNLSDHRLVVCDWDIKRKDTDIEADRRSGPLMAVWNLARRVLPWPRPTRQ